MFHPTVMEKAGGRLTGLDWNGNLITGKTRLPSDVVHYLRHKNEWPVGTTLDEYISSIKQVLSDHKTKIFVSRYSGLLQVGFFRDAGQLAGINSAGYIFVEYRQSIGHIVTANQRTSLSDIINNSLRTDFIWIRK